MPTSIILSVDSLIASMALVMLGMPVARAYRLSLAFLLCDGIASCVGMSMHGSFGPALLCAYLTILITLVARSPFGAAIWVPALFSLDNLFAGIAGQPVHWFDPLTAAFASGLLAVTGVAIAATVSRYASHQRLFVAGLIFLVAIVFW